MLISTYSALLAFGLPGHGEIVILIVLGLLIFGRRLPEVGRNIGRSIVEFKKGIKGIEDEVDQASSKTSPQLPKDAPQSGLPDDAKVGEGENPYAAKTEADSS